MNPLLNAPELAVVLGGGITADGGPLPSTRARAHRAAQLARERPELMVICSGDRQPDAPAGTPSEAALMRDLAQREWRRHVDQDRERPAAGG